MWLPSDFAGGTVDNGCAFQRLFRYERTSARIGPGKFATYREALLRLPNRCGAERFVNVLDAFISRHRPLVPHKQIPHATAS
jgi:hypothetical protein